MMLDLFNFNYFNENIFNILVLGFEIKSLCFCMLYFLFEISGVKLNISLKSVNILKFQKRKF